MLVKRSKIRTGDGWNRPVMGKGRMGWKNIMTRSHDVIMLGFLYFHAKTYTAPLNLEQRRKLNTEYSYHVFQYLRPPPVQTENDLDP